MNYAIRVLKDTLANTEFYISQANIDIACGDETPDTQPSIKRWEAIKEDLVEAIAVLEKD